jgi:hypothetical protein
MQSSQGAKRNDLSYEALILIYSFSVTFLILDIRLFIMRQTNFVDNYFSLSFPAATHTQRLTLSLSSPCLLLSHTHTHTQMAVSDEKKRLFRVARRMLFH